MNTVTSTGTGTDIGNGNGSSSGSGSGINYDALLPMIQKALSDQGIHVPWGTGDDRQSALTDQVLAVLVKMEKAKTISLPDAAFGEVAAQVARRLLGYGVLQPWMERPGVSEIIVRGGRVAVEQDGQIVGLGELAADEYFYHLAKMICDFRGKQLQPASPVAIVDLPDGSRFTAVVPPASVTGTVINIRRFVLQRLSLDELVRLGSLDQEGADFLIRALHTGRVSMLLSGPPGAGKTTLLNALATHFLPFVQVYVVEKFRELNFSHPWLVQVREAQESGVTMADLVNVVATRMYPGLLVVGETVSDESVQFLLAANLGFMAVTTIHGDSAMEALHRLENLVLLTQPAFNQMAVRGDIARGVDLVVHVDRRISAQGRVQRFVQEIVAVEGMQGGEYVCKELKTRRPDGSYTALSQGSRLARILGDAS
jgi:pilus assembly protein CpaF